MTDPSPPAPPLTGTPAQRLIAWGVHLYTAMGLVLALVQLDALHQGDLPRFLGANLIAVFIDGSDGTLARRFKVRERVPFDGALLDNIADYITYVLLPAVAFVAFGLLPGEWRWVAVAPVLASAYQFCQDIAKTEQSFVGFPSYWNLVLLYLVVLQPPAAVTAGLLLVLSALVFVPWHYVYPSKTKKFRPFTVASGLVWFFACLAFGLFPDAPWARPLAWASLSYIGWYLGLSGWLHLQITRGRL